MKKKRVRNTIKGVLSIPKEVDTLEKLKEYCRKRKITFIPERWIYRMRDYKK